MKEKLAMAKAISNQKPTETINFRVELEQNQHENSKFRIGLNGIPYPKETFLKAYDPLESL